MRARCGSHGRPPLACGSLPRGKPGFPREPPSSSELASAPPRIRSGGTSRFPPSPLHTPAHTSCRTDSMTKRVRVAVLMGGRSSEHEISLASARSVLDALDPERYEPVTVEIGRDGRWELGTGEDDGSVAETLPVPTSKVPATLGEVDVVFPVLHGPFGEDGTVQGLLELAGVPYVGAG